MFMLLGRKWGQGIGVLLQLLLIPVGVVVVLQILRRSAV